MVNKITKTLTIVSGPNGAGKTTFALKNYPEEFKRGLFLNADHFAKEICPDDVNKIALSAGKQFLVELDQRLLNQDSIVIETTLSGKILLRKIETAKKMGFVVRFIFLWLETVELCDFRVKMRVLLGGHNIPFDDIKRRHARGLQNLPTYLEVVNEYEIFQASETPILVIHKNMDSPIKIADKQLYDKLLLSMGND